MTRLAHALAYLVVIAATLVSIAYVAADIANRWPS